MKRKIYSFMLAAGLLMTGSCELEGLLDSPNAVNPSSVDANYLMNSIQLSTVSVFSAFTDTDMRLTRMLNQAGTTYDNAYLAQTFSARWTTAYSSALVDIQLMKNLAAERDLNRHLAIAKTLEAYLLMLMVDHFNDIPYSQAFNASEFNPAADAGKDVYAKALQLLNEAAAGFAETNSQGTPSDMFYANNYTKWARLVNSLKLRYYLNTRLVDRNASIAGINALIAEDKMITSNADNFVFRYSRTNANPDSRNPYFTGDYIQGAGDYQSNFYMWHLTEAKSFDDPRVRYYVYRQTNTLTDNPNELRCLQEFPPNHYVSGGFVFCYPNDRGYWGRDHLDNAGIPPDTGLRTVFGLYPAGGKFDNNVNRSVVQTDGNQGAGIEPMMTAAYVHFMLAEASLMLGTGGTAQEHMLAGIKASMDHVRSYALGSSEAAAVTAFQSNAQFASQRDNYMAYVEEEYSSATTQTARMRIVAREYWLAAFGNGTEIYNLYRRTGQPDKMQPGLAEQPGNFLRRYLYPTAYVERNNKAVQVPSSQRVFWDNNPEGNSWVN